MNLVLICLCVLTLYLSSSFAQNRNIPENVIVEKDIVYSKGGDRELLLDIAYPKDKPDAPMPVIVWIHGGAWRAGSKDNNRAMPFVQHGFFTASISYRLSGESIWPAQIHDCKAAIRFLRTHTEKYHIDPKRIGVWGSSAGGHLAAVLGTSGGVKELEGNGGWQDCSSHVQAAVDYYGPSDFLKMKGFPSRIDHMAADSPEALLLGGAVETVLDQVRSVNPITYISKDDPPFLIVHGDKDNTVPYNQSVIFHDALINAGVDSEFITVKGGGHGRWDETTQPTNKEVMKKVVEFFKMTFMQ